MRFQFPLCKVFLVFVVYALALGAFCPLGHLGTIIAVVTGTAGGAIVLLIRSRKDVLSAAVVAVGSTIGAGLAFLALAPKMDPPGITDADYVRDWIILSIGAALGGVFLPWASKR